MRKKIVAHFFHIGNAPIFQSAALALDSQFFEINLWNAIPDCDVDLALGYCDVKLIK